MRKNKEQRLLVKNVFSLYEIERMKKENIIIMLLFGKFNKKYSIKEVMSLFPNEDVIGIYNKCVNTYKRNMDINSKKEIIYQEHNHLINLFSYNMEVTKAINIYKRAVNLLSDKDVNMSFQSIDKKIKQNMQYINHYEIDEEDKKITLDEIDSEKLYDLMYICKFLDEKQLILYLLFECNVRFETISRVLDKEVSYISSIYKEAKNNADEYMLQMKKD